MEVQQLLDEVRKMEIALTYLAKAQEDLFIHLGYMKNLKLSNVSESVIDKYNRMKKLLIAAHYQRILGKDADKK
jgi:hypothetical protein